MTANRKLERVGGKTVEKKINPPWLYLFTTIAFQKENKGTIATERRKKLKGSDRLIKGAPRKGGGEEMQSQDQIANLGKGEVGSETLGGVKGGGGRRGRRGGKEGKEGKGEGGGWGDRVERHR